MKRRKPNDDDPQKKFWELLSDAMAGARENAETKGAAAFDGQRPEDPDYGYSPSNPLFTMGLGATETFLASLRTFDGRKFSWKRMAGSRAECNGVPDIGVDEYQLYLDGEPFRSLYFVMYVGTSVNPPAGMIFSDSEDIPSAKEDADIDSITPEKTPVETKKGVEDVAPLSTRTKHTAKKEFKKKNLLVILLSALLVIAVVVAAVLAVKLANSSTDGGNDGGNDIQNPQIVSVTVYSPQELVDNICSNKEIVLGSRYYDLTDVSFSNPFIIPQGDNGGFIIKGVVNLTIKGNAEIVIEDRFADVLAFENCSNVRLSSLTIGHKDNFTEYNCEGAVLNFDNCTDVMVQMCSLYGCGAVGIMAADTDRLHITTSRIYDCTYSGLWLMNSDSVFINSTDFYDMPKSYSAVRLDDTDVEFENCNFYDITTISDEATAGMIESFNSTFSGSTILFKNCDMRNNNFYAMLSPDTKRTFVTFEKCTFTNNSGELSSPNITYTDCTLN